MHSQGTIACFLYLQVAGPAIQIEMQVFDFSKLRKLVVDVFLRGFLVYTRHKQDPALNSCNQTRKASEIIKWMRSSGYEHINSSKTGTVMWFRNLNVHPVTINHAVWRSSYLNCYILWMVRGLIWSANTSCSNMRSSFIFQDHFD